MSLWSVSESWTTELYRTLRKTARFAFARSVVTEWAARRATRKLNQLNHPFSTITPSRFQIRRASILSCDGAKDLHLGQNAV